MSEDIIFIIERRDSDRILDPLLVKKEELKIGQRGDNDLVLNDPAVSLVHALISKRADRFWVVDVIDSNATLLDGVSIAEAPLSASQVIQIGPFFLRVEINGTTVSILVEREIKAFSGKVRAGLAGGADGAQRRKVRPAGLADREQEALNVYWNTRRREEGKVNRKTLLHPSEVHRFGKLRSLWRETGDLRPAPRRMILVAAIITACIGVLLGLRFWPDVYAPSPLATAHSSAASGERHIALAASANCCSSCHALSDSMQNRCAACHDVAHQGGQSAGGFDPAISEAHRQAGLGCVGCHSEHNGAGFRPGLIDSQACKSCHNDQFRYNDKILGSPHKDPSGNPTVGYIRVGDTIQWKGLTGEAAKNQFHVDHPYAGTRCGYCHQGEWGSPEWQSAPKAACEACHAVYYSTAGLRPIGPNCTTCHKQHGKVKDLSVTLADISPDRMQQIIAQVRGGGLRSLADETGDFTPVAVGGASVRRQGKFVARWDMLSTLWALPWYVWLMALGGGFAGAAGILAVKHSYLRQVGRPANKNAVVPGKVDAPDRQDSVRAEERIVAFPHPKIDPELCIGCYACIEVCPQNVLAMGHDEIAAPVALNLCMDDTSCQVVCPTGACRVINTQKRIKIQARPGRNSVSYMSDVSGLYVIGDISGVPLIKNAIKEGAEVIAHVKGALARQAPDPQIEYDVAIIGVGPAGLSAVLAAEEKGIKYIAIEQDRVLSKLLSYPAGKSVSLKPAGKEVKAQLPIPKEGKVGKEWLLKFWADATQGKCIHIRENETCKQIEAHEKSFTVVTEENSQGRRMSYSARKVILAIGTTGQPRVLPAKGEDLKVPVRKEPPNCPACGAAQQGERSTCLSCKAALGSPQDSLRTEKKVLYRLNAPSAYKGKKCAVVGAGNSAIEAAIALTGFSRDGGEIKFTLDNEVALIVRGDFKADLNFRNKMDLYDCLDAGRIAIHFGSEIQEVREREIVLVSGSERETTVLLNDYVFVLIGTDLPEKFLRDVGITIAGTP